MLIGNMTAPTLKTHTIINVSTTDWMHGWNSRVLRIYCTCNIITYVFVITCKGIDTNSDF